MIYNVTQIDWRVDEPTDLLYLPSEIQIEAENEGYIADVLSDKYGFLVDSFSID